MTCFVVHAITPDDKVSDLVLTMNPNDAYAPRKTGVHNIALKKRVKEGNLNGYKG